MRIALVQMRSAKGAPQRNLQRILAYLDEAHENGADLVCFPEASIGGYGDPDRWREGVLTWDGSQAKRLLEWSSRHDTAIIAGMIEANPDGRPFLSQAVIASGMLCGVYRKHTIAEDEIGRFTPGGAFPVFSHAGVEFGLGICADYANPRVFAEYAGGGATVVFLPSAPGLDAPQSTRDWRSGYDWWRGECHEKLGTFAKEHAIYVAVATQAGRTADEDFPGGGYVFGPSGACIAETSDWSEGILFTNIVSTLSGWNDSSDRPSTCY